MLHLLAAQAPDHPLRPQSLRIIQRNSIMLLSPSPASDWGIPRIPRMPRMPLLIMQKSDSTDGTLDFRTETTHRENGTAVKKASKERSFLVGHDNTSL